MPNWLKGWRLGPHGFTRGGFGLESGLRCCLVTMPFLLYGLLRSCERAV